MNKQFQALLIQWYNSHKRDLPWRKTTDVYRIWLSEIILQQTRVKQGLPYYERFILNYPDVNKLALASMDDVLKDWEGLGYYSRARNMHYTAQYVCDKLNGEFPVKYKDLLKLKGIGNYTAAAISSFAANEPQAVIDGNVIRLISRVFGIKEVVNSAKGKKVIEKLARDLLLKSDPATYNQAIMEFGALQCVPNSPDCSICPLINMCEGYRLDMVKSLPIKNKKVYLKVRYLNFLILMNEAEVIIEKRGKEDIWKGLYQFPLIESNWPLEDTETILMEAASAIKVNTNSLLIVKSYRQKAHLLSHQKLYCNFWVLNLKGQLPTLQTHQKLVDKEDLNSLAFPRPIRRFLESNPITLPSE